MKAIKCLAAGLLLLLGMQSAWAQLYTRDSEFGADTIVVDVRTGLSWLQLSSSNGLTNADFEAVFDSGYGFHGEFTFQSGAYAGYRLASEGEVTGVIDTYVRCATGPCGFSWSDAGTHDPSFVAPALELIRLFGGQINTISDGGQTGLMSGLTTSFWNTVMWTSTGNNYTNADHFGSRNGMTYLIAPVPEPSTYALMLAGLAAVAFVARRRKSQSLSS